MSRPLPIRDFVVDVARATATARIGGSNQNYEKFLAVGRNAAGEPIVTKIGLVGPQGGRFSATTGETTVHVHYAGLSQPPHLADSSAAKGGHPSFVIGADGRTVWEVGRLDGALKVRTVGDDGRLGAWQDYQTDPARYRGYQLDAR